MQQRFTQWLTGLVFLGYVFGCLLLVVFLTQHPLFVATPGTQEEIKDLSGDTQLPDFVAIDQTPERKQAFVDLLLPMIEQKNNYILKNRRSLEKMKLTLAEGLPLNEKQEKKLLALRERYHVTEETYPETARAIEILLLRADIIPQAMVLAQAATESGWGTSRFAVEANNIFGQWCYKPGCGLVPERRAASASHEVQMFASIEASLDSYYRNINTHNAYRSLRQLRAALREKNTVLTGTDLVGGLDKYSSRGHAYIDELRAMIRFNDFENVTVTPAEAETESASAEIPPASITQ